jgi:hypothetical protein
MTPERTRRPVRSRTLPPPPRPAAACADAGAEVIPGPSRPRGHALRYEGPFDNIPDTETRPRTCTSTPAKRSVTPDLEQKASVSGSRSVGDAVLTDLRLTTSRPA